MADANDPPVRMIRKRHHLVKEAAWQNPEERELIEGNIAPDDTVEIVKMRKASPLIDRSQNPVVGRMNAPAAAPVDHQAGRSTGTQMDVDPASSVPGIRHSHRHRHSDGTDFADHLHAHNHVVRHDADDDMEAGDDHHFPLKPTFLSPNYPKIAELAKHAAAMREIAASDRDFHMRTHAKEAVEADLAQIQKLVAKGLLTKAARPPRIRADEVSKLVGLSNASKAARVGGPDLAKGAGALGPILALADERIALNRLLDHPDYTIRAGAQELMDQNLARMEQLHRVNVHKAQVASSELDAKGLGRIVKAAVDQAMRNLDRHIADLNRRST